MFYYKHSIALRGLLVMLAEAPVMLLREEYWMDFLSRQNAQNRVEHRTFASTNNKQREFVGDTSPHDPTCPPSDRCLRRCRFEVSVSQVITTYDNTLLTYINLTGYLRGLFEEAEAICDTNLKIRRRGFFTHESSFEGFFKLRDNFSIAMPYPAMS